MKLSLDIDTDKCGLDQTSRQVVDKYLRGDITLDVLIRTLGWSDRQFNGLLQVLVDSAVQNRAGRKRRVGLD